MTQNIAWRMFIMAALLGITGCATNRDRFESRRHEKYGVYSSLTPEQRGLVDQGQIKIGMPIDAVYIAWGKPSEIVAGENAQGGFVRWLYFDTQLQEYRYWGYRGHGWRGRYWGGPSLQFDYVPQAYVRSEVVFENGVVKEWRHLPRPPG